MIRMHDVVIAGAGPTGLGAAIDAAQRGLDVVVVDPSTDVIDKACGEGLMPSAVRLLHDLGVEIPVHHDFVGIRYVHDAHHVEGEFADGVGWGIRRTVLHAALLARADALGVRRVQGRVDTLVQHPDHVEAAGLRARWLLAADGLRSPIRASLGLERPTRWPRRYGLRQHFFTAPWTDHVEVHWADDCEAYVTPVAPDQVGVAFLFGDAARGGDGRPFDRLLSRFPALRERLGAPASHPRGAGPFAHAAATRVHGRVLLVGDAAGYLDPITGEGVKLGLLGARAALDAITAGRPASYEAAWRSLYRRYALTTGGLLLLTRPRALRRALVPLLRWTPGVMRHILRTLAD
jgi:flavin-dependent dehydrogenase